MLRTDQTIINTLLKNENVTFRQLQKGSRITPRILRRHLKTLVQDGFVDEKGRDRDWKPGKPLDYSLTKKGREAAIRNAIGSIEDNTRVLVESFARMRDIYGTILSNPRIAQDYQSMLFEAASTEFKGELPSKEQLREVAKASAKLEQPLIQSYMNMHRLLCRILGFEGREANMLFGIDGNGSFRVTTQE